MFALHSKFISRSKVHQERSAGSIFRPGLRTDFCVNDTVEIESLSLHPIINICEIRSVFNTPTIVHRDLKKFGFHLPI